jgi:Rod binding domain-containing protein
MTDASSFALQAQTALMAGREAPTLSPTGNLARARKTAEEFEAFYLSQVLQPMFSNLSAEEPFGGGFAEDMWRSLQVEEYGKAITRAGGVGIADAIMREIMRTQEVQ